MVLYEVFVEFQKDFLKVEGNQITIGIKSKPIRGQANKEIIKKYPNISGFLPLV